MTAARTPRPGFALAAAAAGLLLSAPGPARAAFYATHALAVAGVNLGVADGAPLVRIEGKGPLTTEFVEHTYFRGSTNTGSATAAVSHSPDSLLRVYSSISSSVAGDGYAAVANAQAYWRDVAYWVGPGAPPPVLDFHFHVDGRLSTEPNGIPFPGGPVVAQALPAVFDYDFDFTDRTFETFGGFGAVKGGLYGDSDSGGWSSGGFDGSVLDATFTLRSQYNAAAGGYLWTVALRADAAGDNGRATSDLLNTLSFTGVTLTDGTPAAVTFDSGLRFGPAAVPEPSGLAMLGIGAAGLLGYARRRAARRAA